MARNQLDTMIGCASIPMLHNDLINGDAAASIWRKVKATHLAPIEHQVFPRLSLPVDQLDDSLDVDPPALIRGDLRMGQVGLHLEAARGRPFIARKHGPIIQRESRFAGCKTGRPKKTGAAAPGSPVRDVPARVRLTDGGRYRT